MGKKKQFGVKPAGLSAIIIFSLFYNLAYSQTINPVKKQSSLTINTADSSKPPCALSNNNHLLKPADSFNEVKESTLKVIITPDKQIYKQNEPINLTISLKNTGKKKIKLFHPDSINKTWPDWELKCFITKPDGREIILQPDIFYSAVSNLEKKHYKSLAFNKTINIPVNFQIKKPKENAWKALKEISAEENKKFPQEIRKGYNIKGNFGYGRFGDKYYLLLEDKLANIFDLTGKYNLKFQYKNHYKDYTLLNKKNPSIPKTIVIPEAWAGSLSETITVEIIK